MLKFCSYRDVNLHKAVLLMWEWSD